MTAFKCKKVATAGAWKNRNIKQKLQFGPMFCGISE